MMLPPRTIDTALRMLRGAGTDRSRTEVVLLARPLRCHSCYKSIHGQACVDLDRAYTDIKRCRDDQPYCMVQHYTVDGQLITFSRACAKTCTTGCQSAGSVYKVENCYACCQDNFCNTDSSAAKHVTRSSTLLSSVVPLSLAIIRRLL
ncbi:hypothetical protein NP493_622g01016 [Ridgeia piscesae]|uniref:Snake toxin/toxin-like domain-containing protein n=1 Tax=Ridgeia piscesae TaxID=27915 RepID=A0AAD9NNY5_RIDPI|nr:hypothetical protein NP493_622g01016 [Ridgeia piscesae]